MKSRVAIELLRERLHDSLSFPNPNVEHLVR